MPRIHRAAWVLPIVTPPIRHGFVAVEDGRIIGVGESDERGRNSGSASDGSDAELEFRARVPRGIPQVAILPGLINAHTHLELSWMTGLVPRARSMGAWIRALMALRRNEPPSGDAQRQAAVAAVSEARRRGTAAFGDVGNSLLAADVLANAEIPAVLFHELIGFGPGDANARAREGARRVMESVRLPVRPGLAPHAPYSVSPDLFRAVTAEASAHGLRSSVHLGESAEEVEFLMTGRGDIAETLKQLGAWNDVWSAPGVDPAAYLDGLGVLRPGLLVVHATQLSSRALALLASRGCVIVSCPRSNRWVGAGDPPLDAFYASGAPVAFGTDSLASSPDLDMFAELAAARAVSRVPAARLLESATRRGAEALGLGDELGSLAPGRRAALLAVRIPEGVADVEEYLVNGRVQPADTYWLE
jgi:cytosine/adenosine deaminase-related metal-dependent hydrolase